MTKTVIVDANNIHKFETEMEQAYKLRHEIFVEEKGWHALDTPNCREIDQFDTSRAVHMLCFDGDELVGYQRLLPTTQPYLLNTVYPHLCEEELPCDHATWEWTRYAVQKQHRARGRMLSPVANHLLSAIVEWGLETNVNSIIIEMQPLWLLRLVQLHFKVFPLGIAQKLDDEEVLAVKASFDQRTLSRLQEIRGNKQPVLSFLEPAITQ